MNEDLTKKLPKSDSDKLSYVVTAVQDLTSRIKALDKRVEGLDKRVETLDEKVEERLYDTRPIWEQVVANVAQLQEGQQRIEEAFETSRNESRESRTVLRDILRRMSIFNDTLVTIQADYRDIYDRVRHLELSNS
jgi:predicted transcriptional regulator